MVKSDKNVIVVVKSKYSKSVMLLGYIWKFKIVNIIVNMVLSIIWDIKKIVG